MTAIKNGEVQLPAGVVNASTDAGADTIAIERTTATAPPKILHVRPSDADAGTICTAARLLFNAACLA